MKKAKKLVGFVLVMIMLLAMTTTAFAQSVNVGTDGGTITIENAAKGETYTIYKLFDATVTGTDDGSIAYTGTVPAGLTDYFIADANGYISSTDAAWKTGASETKEMSDGLRTALAAWAGTATAAASAAASAESDGSTLVFTNVPYGYYVVTTTQGEQMISVDSTNPTASIVDKNRTTPHDLTKTVGDDKDVTIGQTVTYKVSFATANYDGAGTTAEKILSYTIEDTLPDFLTGVNVESIIVDNDGDALTTDDQANVTAQFANKKIVIDWYDESNGKFLYDNGATITIEYTAVVTDKAAIDGAGNANKVTVTWDTENGPKSSKLETTETIYTYAIALKKVNDEGVALAGAEFQFPFYVKATPDSTDGAYIYAYSNDEYAALTDEDKAVVTNTITTPASGEIVVKGVASGAYSITEVTAPNGYNKLLSPVTVNAVKTGATTTNTTFYLNENGQVVDTETDIKVEYSNDKLAATAVLIVNMTGTELPSTGGIGTTIFYVIGGILVLGAGVVLVAKKRMRREA